MAHSSPQERLILNRARRIRPLAWLLSVANSREGDRVTTLELFVDLVYVFAFTQVTTLMTHGQPPDSVVDGFVVLSLLWWSWCALWRLLLRLTLVMLQLRSDLGILRVPITE